MKKYLVVLDGIEYRAGHQSKFEKVGKAESMPDMLIVQTEQGIEAIRECVGVVAVEEDGEAEILDAGWALPWISNAPQYENVNTGMGVDIYVVDTGVRGTHEDLSGRVDMLYSFDGEPYALVGDQPAWHGTSVAGCAVGTTYGTAKGAFVYNCRINWTHSDILKALDTILRHHIDKPDYIPSIVNFSGASISSIIGLAFERLTRYGVAVVAAAGNSSEPEPRYPARNIWVTSVGAINQYGDKAFFSNGKCDVYAPGQDIKAPDVFSDTATRTTSGTSFACPYYAGLLACLLEGSDKFNTNLLVSAFNHSMRNNIAETGRITFPNGNLPTRSVTSNGLGGTYYESPIRHISDEDIGVWLAANVGDPQLVADVCKEYNLSRPRIDRIAGAGDQSMEIDKYFSDAGVTPWWFT